MKLSRYLLLLIITLASVVAHSEEIEVEVTTPVVDGIDVSDHQKVIDWDATARDKRVKYVYIKATEGATYQSRLYRQNLENARRVGIKVGSYHFLRTGSRIRDQFENFKRVVKKHEQDLLPLIDIEVRQGWTNQQVRDSVKLFADLIEEYYGCRPMIYTSSHFYNHILGRAFADYPLFIARYATNAPSLDSGQWTMWQYSEKGRIAGISTTVDLSCFNKGRGLHDILIKEHRMGSRKRSNADAVDQKDKPGSVKVKEAPKMSKKQEKELKKQQEKERKARERAEKLRREEEAKQAEKQRKLEEQQRKKAQQQAHEQQRKLEEQQRKQAEQQRKLEEQQKKKEKELEKARQEQLKKQQEAEAKKAEQTRRQQEVQQRLHQQQEEQKKAKEEQRNKLQQQKQNATQARQYKSYKTDNDDDVRQSTRSRKTNKSSADND